MSVLAWLSGVLGRPIDFDGQFGPQCVDLVNHYLTYARGTQAEHGNAVDLIGQTVHGGVWVPNAPTNAPKIGDVVVWHANVPSVGIGQFGHCAVVLAAGVMHLLTADQNWLGVQRVTVNLHSYAGVAGWLSLSELRE